jgi:CheY-like chemotaxis protein
MSIQIKTCPRCNKAIDQHAARCIHCGAELEALTGPSRFEAVEMALKEAPAVESIVVSGRYEIERELGRGGMGVVFLAHDKELGSRVALKLLLVEFASDERFIDAMRAEAKLCLSLSHPNIVRLHTFESSGRSAFLVMEYVDGPSLADLLEKKEKMPLEEVTRYMRQACAALDYAHSEGVIHKDIKPANFLLGTKGKLRLADFGIAQRARYTYGQLTQRVVMGTPTYMSPEQLLGQKIDHRTDIYSLGAVAYELLAGHPPFGTENIEKAIMLNEPEPIAGVPDRANSAIAKALRKDRYRRWQSATAFYQALAHGKAQKEVTPPETIQWPAPGQALAARQTRKLRVLAVDDDNDIRSLVQATLGLAGYDVQTAVDGQDAIEKLGISDYDLVVLDIQMPRLDGIRMLTRIRSAGSNVPVLMLTAHSEHKSVLEGYRSGANYYMTKPFAVEKLIAASRFLMGDFTESERQGIEGML